MVLGFSLKLFSIAVVAYVALALPPVMDDVIKSSPVPPSTGSRSLVALLLHRERGEKP